MEPTLKPITRRRFLHATGTALVAPAVLTAAATLRAQQKADSQETLRIGLVGCGGRGMGAASQALTADANSKIVALADVFPEQMEKAVSLLSASHPDRVTVPAERRFAGVDAYEKLLASGVDVVLLASPPGFRPQHLAAAVEAGKHVFAEKPMAVDAVGYRLAQAALAKAKEKKLSVRAGYCWRFNTSRREAFQRLHQGGIGDLVSYHGTFLGGPVKPMPVPGSRPPEVSDVQWQLKNWYNFSWLSGDGLVEQAVHSVDKMLWAFRDAPPLSCFAVGGRQIPNEGGNIYDHMHVIYEFANGASGQITQRQTVGCHSENVDYLHGTAGLLTIGRGGTVAIEGPKPWRFRGEQKDMYQIEHDELFAAIRSGQPTFDGEWMMQSTLTAIMGREAAYTGKKITWEEILGSQQDLAPDTLRWEDRFTPTPLPQPGVTKFI